MHNIIKKLNNYITNNDNTNNFKYLNTKIPNYHQNILKHNNIKLDTKINKTSNDISFDVDNDFLQQNNKLNINNKNINKNINNKNINNKNINNKNSRFKSIFILLYSIY